MLANPTNKHALPALLLTTILAVAPPVKAQPPSTTRPAGPPLANIEKAIVLGGEYLAKACKSDGQFVYRINLDPRIHVRPKYNVLRHAGTIYALAQRHQWREDASVKAAILRAVGFLRTRCIGPVKGRKDLLAVWSDSAMTGSMSPRTAKLGGAGLALIALCSVEKIAPKTTPLAELRKLGAFIRFMQRGDGSFYSKFIPVTGGRDDSWTSLYYPGEAALGLLMLYECDPQAKWLQAAADAVGYLAASRKDAQRIPPDHWAMLATAKLLPLYAKITPPVPRGRIIAHAVDVCESLLARRVLDPASPAVGSIGGFGQTTPTSTRMEGLLAALTFLPDAHAPLRRRIRTTAAAAIAFLLRSQKRTAPHLGAVPRAIAPLPGDSSAIRNFNRRVTEVRIDYVQHFISALLAHLTLTGK